MAANGEKKNIVIIGGGIIGCTSAYYLTRHPAYDPSKHTITLLEASKIAGGASGKAGGLLALWAYPSSLVPLSYKLHEQLSDEHGGEERWGYRAVHCGQVDCLGRKLTDRKKEMKVDGKDGDMDGQNGDVKGSSVSLQKRSKEALGRLRAAGVPAELDWISPDTQFSYDEMGDPSTTAQVHPFQFTTAMAELAAEKGAVIKTNTSVQSIKYDSSNAVTGVVTADGTTLSATDIVIAAGPWTPHLLPQAPITAMRAHSVTIRPSREVSAYALFTQIKPPRGTRGQQTSTPEIYARPKNEVYACGEGDTHVPLPALSSDVAVDEKRCQEIVDQVSSISDELADGEVTARQACYLPNGGPWVGLTGRKGEVLAAGHTCWGIQNGPGTGKLVGEFVFDGEARSAKVQGLSPGRWM